MCTTCGCDVLRKPAERSGPFEPTSFSKVIRVEEDILARNNRIADLNRQEFQKHENFVLNLVSSPGSGKTTLLEKTLQALSVEIPCAVIEGDQQTDRDALRIARTGVPVHQINTGAGCHLDAEMVRKALERFDLPALRLLFIENVGNLVCPAEFDLGENFKVAILSVTEGEDKPLKYPNLFAASKVLVLNKIDLLPHLDFDRERCLAYAREVSPGVRIFEVSARTGEGMQEWLSWLRGLRWKKSV